MPVYATTLNNVMQQAQMSGKADADLKALLNKKIASVTQKIERYLGRHIEAKQRTEYYDVDGCNGRLDADDDDALFHLKGWPVSAVASVKNSDEGDYDDHVLTAGSDFIAPVNRGRLVIKSSLTIGADALQVVYTGGMATTTEAFVDAYPDIADAADVQVVYEYLRRKTPGAASVSNAGGTVEQEGELKLLKEVKRALDKHKPMGAMIG